MMIHREWQDEPEMFDAVLSALQKNDDGLRVSGLDEPSSYREQGYIVVRGNGRTFHIQLHEVL